MVIRRLVTLVVVLFAVKPGSLPCPPPRLTIMEYLPS